MQLEFRPIAEARDIPFGTIAALKMHSGRTYQAICGFRDNSAAWWPLPGQLRLRPIGHYEPESFAVQVMGDIATKDWTQASKVQHGAKANLNRMNILA